MDKCNYFQININGFISFSINYLSYRPMPFPHYNSEDADLLGVFWSDYDSTGINCDCSLGCRTCGRGIVYYQVYSCDPMQSSSPEGFVQNVLSKATTEGRAYIPGFNIATWVMIVTWSQMVPFPYSYNQYSSEVCKINCSCTNLLFFLVHQKTYCALAKKTNKKDLNLYRGANNKLLYIL